MSKKLKAYYLCDALGIKFTNYNPSPVDDLKDHYDCSVRALTRAFNKDYDTVYFDLIRKAITYRYAPNQTDMIISVIKDYGGKQLEDRTEMVATFCARHMSGTYIIFTEGHVVAYVNGTLCDNYFILTDGEDARSVIDNYITEQVRAIFKVPTAKGDNKDE